MRFASLLLFVASSMLVACAQGTAPRRVVDAYVPPADAGPPPDSGRPDAGRDAGLPMDAGGSDAGELDAGPMCAESPCTLVLPQCGCADGEGCYLDGTGRSCQTAGRVGAGVRCAGSSSCQPGHICVGSRGISFCHPVCDDEGDCVGNGSLCTLRVNDGMGGTIPNLTMCSVACDPTSVLGCPTGSGCHPQQEADGAMRFYSHCQPAGLGFEGAPCTASFDCRAGLSCINSGGMFCRQYCAVGRTICPTGRTCMGFGTPPAIIGSTEYGACL